MVSARLLLDDVRALGLWSIPAAAAALVPKQTIARLIRQRCTSARFQRLPPAVFGQPKVTVADDIELGRRETMPSSGAQWLALRPGAEHDVKLQWEPARLGRQIRRARTSAARGRPPDSDSYESVRSLIDTCLDADGWLWESPLEVGLRALRLIEFASRCAPDPDLDSRLQPLLVRSYAFLWSHLGTSATRIRNNHLLGEAVSLAVIGRCLGRPGTVDRRLLSWSVRAVVSPDGAIADDSVAYARFCAELCLLAATALDHHGCATAADAIHARLESSTSAEGLIPDLGDNDDVVPFCAPRRTRTSAKAERRTESSVAHLSSDTSARAWVKTSLGRYHGHDDLGSVTIADAGRWLIVDPGTYSYAADDPIGRWMRSCHAHNMPVPGRGFVRRAHRTFRWIDDFEYHVTRPDRPGSESISVERHHRHIGVFCRTVTLSGTDLIVVDDTPERATTTWVLAPHLRPRLLSDSEVEFDGHRLCVDGASVRIRDAHVSPSYGVLLATHAIEVASDPGRTTTTISLRSPS